MKNKKKIVINEPSLFPLEELIPYLEEIWRNKWLTNFGIFHKKFEDDLAKFLDCNYISLTSNATLGLILALKSLGKNKGEVIISSFGFIATANALIWNGFKPVFVDIYPDDLNISTKNIEAAITKKTVCIMPTHIFGYPCKVYEIDDLSKKYNIPIIYDAAHSFGVKINEKSILKFGNLSVVSFHATKVFSTIEGGAVICQNANQKKIIDNLKNNIPINLKSNLTLYGLNSKMNEVQSAFGLISLKYINENIKKRKIIATKYRKELIKIKGINMPSIYDCIEYNYSYFPIIINRDQFGISRDSLLNILENENIICKPYFYPPINEIVNEKTNNLSITYDISRKILCLPIHEKMSLIDVNYIVSIINNSRNKAAELI